MGNETQNSSIIINERANSIGHEDDEAMYQYITKARNAICQITLKDGYGSGFFCKIPITENYNNLSNVLLTCEHILNQDIIFSEKDITIIVNNTKKTISLKNRKKWSDKQLDYSCIEILEEDNIDDYYQLDDIIFKRDYSNNMYSEKGKRNKVIIFAIMKGRRGHCSGLIKNIANCYFYHNCKNYKGSSGGVIVNKNNNCVIGIHKGNASNNDKERKNEIWNIGIFINDIIKNIKSNKENTNSVIKFNYKNNNINNNSINKIFNESKPYIKALLVSFYEIAKIKIYFIDDYSNFKTRNCFISYYISKFLQNYSQKNYPNCEKSIEDLVNIINQKDINVLKNVDFGKLINFFINKCHEELNTKQKTNKKPPEKDYNEKISYYNYKNYFLEQNESAIQNYFCGIKEETQLYKCCKLTKYSFETFSYLLFNLAKIEKSIDIQTLINILENVPKEHKNYCSMCCIESDTLIQYKLYDNPEILVVILNNINKIPVIYTRNIKTKKNEYKLLCCITESKNEIKFNIIFNLEKIWHVIINNDYTEAKQLGESEKKSLTQYPCVLFYEKGQTFIDDKKTDMSYISNNTTSNHINNNKINNSLNTKIQYDINKKNLNYNLIKDTNNVHTNNNNKIIYKMPTYNKTNNTNIINKNIIVMNNI